MKSAGLVRALQARPQKMRYALSNGFGFGGVNASLLLKRWESSAPLRYWPTGISTVAAFALLLSKSSTARYPETMAPIRLIENGIDALSSQPKLSIKVSFERRTDHLKNDIAYYVGTAHVKKG